MTAARAGIDPVLAGLAVPELYRRNGFRALGLAVSATTADARIAAQRRQIAARRGQPADAGGADGADDMDGPRAALRRLRDPVQRFVDEFFWFWPLPSGAEDLALAAWTRGDRDQAATLPDRLAADGGPAGADVDSPVARHNLAVLTLASVLEDELAAGDGQPSPGRQRLAARWAMALRHWRGLLGDDAFWTHVLARAQAARDPRLDNMAARLRASLPEFLLTISAALAARLAEDDHADQAAAQATVMRAAGFGAALTDEVSARAVAPVTERLRSMCQADEDRADADPGHADQAARHLIDHARPLLTSVDALLPAGHPARDGVHDEVARRVLMCQIPYASKTEDWAGSITLLTEAHALAATGPMRTRLDENLTIVRQNLKAADVKQTLSTCWFCHKPARTGHPAEVKMHGDVTRTPIVGGTNVQWKTTTIRIPTCGRCQRRTKMRRARASLSSGLGVIIALISLLGLIAAFNGVLIGLVGILTFVPAIALVKYDPSKREQNQQKEFPPVKELLAQGWAFGERPT